MVHSDFVYLVVNGEAERDFLKFGRCKGRFNGAKCHHQIGVKVANVVVDHANAILENHLMAGERR